MCMIDEIAKPIDKPPNTVFHAGIGGMAKRFADHDRIEWHHHDCGQIIFGASGVMRIETAGGLWFAPPERALWMPPGVAHAITMLGAVEMRTLYVAREHLSEPAARGLTQPRVLAVTDLLRALLLAAFDAEFSRRAHLLAPLVMDEVERATTLAAFLPMPATPALARLAAAAMADPTWSTDFTTLADAAGLAARTASRLFPQETGLTFKRWRQHARIMTAIEHLNRGERPKAIARALGFSSQAALAQSFRTVTGLPPSAFDR